VREAGEKRLKSRKFKVERNWFVGFSRKKKKDYTEVAEDAEFTEKRGRRERQEHSPFEAQGKQE
jgi:hypothetical protein